MEIYIYILYIFIVYIFTYIYLEGRGKKNKKKEKDVGTVGIWWKARLWHHWIFLKQPNIQWAVSWVSGDSCEDFPGGQVVKNLPANAGDMVSIPGLGSHAAEQWSPCTATIKPMLGNKKSHHREKLTHLIKSSPHSLKLEKTYLQQWKPRAPKNK